MAWSVPSRDGPMFVHVLVGSPHFTTISAQVLNVEHASTQWPSSTLRPASTLWPAATQWAVTCNRAYNNEVSAIPLACHRESSR